MLDPSRGDALSLEEGRFLVRLAREAISKYLLEGMVMQPPAETPEKLKKRCGVFVTLTGHSSGELRGCIGYPEPVERLVTATIRSAIEAATEDPRFPRVSLEELERRLIVEVSVLTEPEEVKAPRREVPKHIRVGKDGLIVGRGLQRGLLLPQVAVEWGWGAEEFLTHCCLKAGLPPDDWLLEDTKIQKFQAAIFKEVEPKGRIERVDHET
ncbi:TIGR00296 family protein [Candidatus Bathyarchaeota archaeon]|nr:TIGR00296 family protein [Candidatus Bathyarchaeota archaeon]